MIKNLSLENFKCFGELTDFSFSNLTLITGINGAGKSSVIQSLLLLRQSWLDKFVDLRTSIKLDGDLVNIGDTKSLRNASGTSPLVKVILQEDNLEEVVFCIDTSSSKTIAPVSIMGPFDSFSAISSLLGESFVYLYADRTIPRKRYKKTEPSLTDSGIGDRQGSNAAFRLLQAVNNNEEVEISALRREGPYVSNNVAGWLNYILGGCPMRVSASEESTDEVAVRYFVKDESGLESEMTPENVAFGNSYILPIVLAILTAKKTGSLVIIENPEAHLHPAAQTRMGEFLSIAAHNGVQIIVESHSEHLMNGIRISVKKGELSSDQVEFCYIDIRQGKPRKMRIPVKDDGELLRWPNGFFDEWEKALMEIGRE